MNNIQRNNQSSNEIRGRMAIRGTSLRKWALSNGYNYSMVYQVACGYVGKLQSPVTLAGKIKNDLKRDGYWPEEDNNDPPAP